MLAYVACHNETEFFKDVFQSQLYWLTFSHLQHSPGTQLENWAKNQAFLFQQHCIESDLNPEFLLCNTLFPNWATHSFFFFLEGQLDTFF